MRYVDEKESVDRMERLLARPGASFSVRRDHKMHAFIMTFSWNTTEQQYLQEEGFEPAIANVQRACSTNPEYGDLWRELRLLEEKVIAFETHGEGFSGS